MDVSKKQAKVITQVLDGWRQEGVLTDEQLQHLQQHLSIRPFDWQRLSRYAFWTALVCVVIAFGSLFADDYLLALIENWLSLSGLGRAAGLGLIAAGFYAWGFRRQRRQSQWRYSNESILFLGVLFTALGIWQLGMALDNGSGNIAPLFLVGCVIYGLVGWAGRSGMIWLFFLLALGNYFGAATGYMSGWGAYWLSMNYPLRFVLFGAVLLALCVAAKPWLATRGLFTVSKSMGLLYLFIALWILSIFGSDDLDSWYATSPSMLLPWALLFAVAAIIAVWISLQHDDGMLRGYGLTFLGINLYTRYFEYFWNTQYKVVFFLVLAVALALTGRYAEKVWRLGQRPRA